MEGIYRITSKEFGKDLSGRGADLYGGRWNNVGTPLLYTAEHISLSILEIMVHFDALTIPPDLVLVSLEIPRAEIKNFSRSKFSKIFDSPNAEFLFKEEGEKWIKSNSSLALKVPSIIVEEEHNILINPTHPNFKSLKRVQVSDLMLDRRLFK